MNESDDILKAIELFCDARGKALELEIKHPNRANAKKKRQGKGCHMCKPFKHGFESNFKLKEKQKRMFKEINEEMF